jgi:hypothetical protein
VERVGEEMRGHGVEHEWGVDGRGAVLLAAVNINIGWLRDIDERVVRG